VRSDKDNPAPPEQTVCGAVHATASGKRAGGEQEASGPPPAGSSCSERASCVWTGEHSAYPISWVGAHKHWASPAYDEKASSQRWTCSKACPRPYPLPATGPGAASPFGGKHVWGETSLL